jgi:kynurenine 3-monooxygenase
LPLKHVVGADGAGSILRRYLVECVKARSTEEMLSHGYKELTLPAGPNGEHRLDKNALHVWPRTQFMLIALPNLDGSFTATLFLPHDGPNGFSSLTTPAEFTAFFRTHFPDAYELFPDAEQQFFANPTGTMGTVHLDQWSNSDEAVLIGDAAHAIVPFHGQGMNCAFEDCLEFDQILSQLSGELMIWSTASALMQVVRKPNSDAIAAMALENYIVMRDSVRDPKYQLQQSLSLELERRFPNRFIPRYSMVMFHHEIPYEIAMRRGSTQANILRILTDDVAAIDDVDWQKAKQLIETELSPLK